jgi:hypothetical protein
LRVERIGPLASEFGIGQPLPGNLAHQEGESVGIVKRGSLSWPGYWTGKHVPSHNGQGGKAQQQRMFPGGCAATGLQKFSIPCVRTSPPTYSWM